MSALTPMQRSNDDNLVQSLEAFREGSKVAQTMGAPSAEFVFQANRTPLAQSFVYQKMELVREKIQLLETPEMTLAKFKSLLEDDLAKLVEYNGLEVQVRNFSSQKKLEKENQPPGSEVEANLPVLIESLRTCEIQALGNKSLNLVGETAFAFSRRLYQQADRILEAVESAASPAEAARKSLINNRAEELKLLDQECRRLKREIVAATSTQEASSSEVTRLTRKNEELNSEQRKLTHQTQSREKEVNAAQVELGKLKAALEGLNTEVNGKSEEIEKLKSSLASKKKEWSQLNGELTDTNQKLEQEKKSLVRAQEESRKIQAEKKKEEGLLKVAREEFQRISNELLAVQERTQAVKRTSEQFTQRLKIEEEQKEALKRQVETLDTEVNGLKLACDDQERMRQDLLKKRKSSAEEVERLTKLLDEALMKEGQLKRTQSVRDNNGHLQKIIEDYEETNAQLTLECEELRNVGEALDGELNLLTQRINRGREWRDSAEIRSRDVLFRTQQVDLERLAKGVEQQKNEIELLKMNYERQKKELEELAPRNRETQIELEEQKEINESMRRQLSKFRQETINICDEQTKELEKWSASSKKLQQLYHSMLVNERIEKFVSSLSHWESRFNNPEALKILEKLQKEMDQQFQLLQNSDALREDET